MPTIQPAAAETTALASPSFFPGKPWLDTNGTPINAHGGGLLHHDDVYYWFGEHKIAGDAGNVAHVGVHCYSSRDLYHWKDEGIALPVTQRQGDIERGCILERPKVIFNKSTGKFVMWFHLERKGLGYSDALSGVAVADLPAGPYQYQHCFRPNAGSWPRNLPATDQRLLNPEEESLILSTSYHGGDSGGLDPLLFHRRDFFGGQMSRDMTLFVDEDGTAYQIYASEENATLHISRLSSDYLHSTGDYIRLAPGGYNEAPAIAKHDGRYYMITSGCTGWAPNAARSFAAREMLGHWNMIGNPCRGTQYEMETTFESQSTHLFPVGNLLVFLADRWCPENAIDGRYVWLPAAFEDGLPVLRWHDRWSLPVA